MKKVGYLFDKYRALSKPLKASFWFLVCSILQKGISTITAPIFMRLLTKAEYGEFTLYTSWLNIFSIFATINIHWDAYARGLSKSDTEEDRNRLTFSLQSLCSLITIVIFAVFFCVQDFLEPIIRLSPVVMLLMFANIFFTPSLGFWSMHERYYYRYVKLILVSLGMAIANPLLGFALLHAFEDRGLARIVSIAAVEIAVGAFFYIVNCMRAQGKGMVRYWKYGLKFSLPLLPHYISGYILDQSDRVMIGSLCGEERVAEYGAANTICQLVTLFTSNINKIFIPWTYERMKAKDYASLRKKTNYLIVMIGLITFFALLIAPEVLLLLGGEQYAESKWCIPPLLLSVFCIFLYSLFGNIEFYFEKTKFAMIASTLAALLNIGLNLWFIPIYGYVAAAYTTLVCYFCYCVFHAIFVRAICKKEVPGVKVYNLKFLFGFTILMIGLSGLAMPLYRTIAVRYAVVAVLAIVGICLFFRFRKKKKQQAAAKASDDRPEPKEP